MEPYEGDKPYIFISYAHLDAARVARCITLLQRSLCYVWYDKGNHAGDDWAENIARHLVDSACMLLFISRNSIQSVNVNNELIMALNYKKRVIPIVIDDVKLPLGWEIKIGHLHTVHIGEDEKFDAVLREIPPEVFKKICSPFYENEEHSFYFTTDYVRDDMEKVLNIFCETDGKQELLWRYASPTPHELVPARSREKDEDGTYPVLVNVLCQAQDDFFDMKDNGCILFSVRLSMLLPYPLNGPEGDGILLFALVNPRGAAPKVVLLDSMTSYDSWRDAHHGVCPGYEYDPLVPNDNPIMRVLPKMDAGSK